MISASYTLSGHVGRFSYVTPNELKPRPHYATVVTIAGRQALSSPCRIVGLVHTITGLRHTLWTRVVSNHSYIRFVPVAGCSLKGKKGRDKAARKVGCEALLSEWHSQFLLRTKREAVYPVRFHVAATAAFQLIMEDAATVTVGFDLRALSAGVWEEKESK